MYVFFTKATRQQLIIVFTEHATTSIYKDSNYQGLVLEGHNGGAAAGNPYYSGLIPSGHHSSPNYPTGTAAAAIGSHSGIFKFSNLNFSKTIQDSRKTYFLLLSLTVTELLSF